MAKKNDRGKLFAGAPAEAQTNYTAVFGNITVLFERFTVTFQCKEDEGGEKLSRCGSTRRGEASRDLPTPADRSSSSSSSSSDFLGWLPKRIRFWSKKRHKRRPSLHSWFSSLNIIGALSDREKLERILIPSSISNFNLEELKAATNNFADSNVIGDGGFGKVYKASVSSGNGGFRKSIHDFVLTHIFGNAYFVNGKLSNGCLVAIKVASSAGGHQKAEFSSEILILSYVKHPNIVRLLGYCIKENMLIVVYELVENRSLGHFLFGYNEVQIQLDWHTRCKVCLGVAKGLLHLHGPNLSIVHRDVKASNILLDKNLNPKIADFGVSTPIFLEDVSNTTKIVGTIGYLDPEYASTGRLTLKSDVYGFGVILLEIVSGVPCKSKPNAPTLVEQVHDLCQKQGNLLKFVDKRLAPACPMREAFAILLLGVECTKYSAIERPKMSEVVSILEGLQRKEEKLHPRLSKYTQILSSSLDTPILSTNGLNESKKLADGEQGEEKDEEREVDKSIVPGRVEMYDSGPTHFNVETEAREPFDPSDTEDLDMILSYLSNMAVMPKGTVEVTPISDTMKISLETFEELKNLLLGINFREALQADTKFKILHIHEAIGCSALPDHQSHILDRLMNFLVQTEELSAAISTQDERSLYIAKYDSIKQKVEETKKGGKELQDRASKLRTCITSIKEEMAKLQQQMDGLRQQQANKENELSEIRRIAASSVKEAAPHASWLVKEFDKRTAAGRELQEVGECLSKGQTDWNAIQDLLRS